MYAPAIVFREYLHSVYFHNISFQAYLAAEKTASTLEPTTFDVQARVESLGVVGSSVGGRMTGSGRLVPVPVKGQAAG